jgi:hypothetical protein
LLPRIEEYQPSRIGEELPDLVFFTVENTQPPRLIIESDGTRLSIAYGNPARADISTNISGPDSCPW